MKADIVIHNANIFTSTGKNNGSTALAVWKNRFIDIGSDQDIHAWIGPDTECFNARGNTVLPGFNDSHCHMASVAAEHTLQVDCTPERCRSIGDIIEAVREKAAATPPGQWIIGFGYDETKLEESRHILSAELDMATDRHPVLVKSFTYHFGVVNSKALQLAKIDRTSADPPGGEFERNANGKLTGLCLEEAFFMWIPGFSQHEPLIPSYSEEEKTLGLKQICSQFNRMGITSVGDASSTVDTIRACREADRTGELTVRINMMVHERSFEEMRNAGMRTGFGNEKYKIGSIKSFADGACAGRTAWLSTPYGKDDGYRGIKVKEPDELEHLVRNYHDAGFQISIHANGDAAITMVLDAYEKALSGNPRNDHRHRVEHCTFVTDKILQRMKSLGVCAAPFTNYITTQYDKLGVYGEWIHNMFAHRSFLDHGIPVGASTDFPVVTANPLVSLQTMVTRRNPEGYVMGEGQKISLEEAIKVYTTGSAYLSFDEDIKGTIEPGKLADCVILDRDIFKIPLSEIADTSVVRTIWNGKPVF